MARARFALVAVLVLVLAGGLVGGLGTRPASASTIQQSIIEDDTQLHLDPVGTLATFRELGVTTVKVGVHWNSIAPDAHSFRAPKHFDASDPAAYPAQNWAFLDEVVTQAQADGLNVGLMLTGPAPWWATGRHMPKTRNCPCGQWKPKATAFEGFVEAVGKRFDGSYVPPGSGLPLPRVSWWSVWNEPNYGPNLAPQARDHDSIELSPAEYRGLLDAAWDGLAATGHVPATDTILFGETAPRGRNHPIGNFSGMKPLRFLRALYCVNGRYRELRGRAASVRGCPTRASGSRSFAIRNPALFAASGFADHPYAQGTPPDIPTYACGSSFCWNRRTRRSDPGYADFAELGRLGRTLDRLVSVYGSRVRLPLWNTEFGYWTDPPDHAHGSLSPVTAALYMNWAQYLTYRNPRVVSYDQYLLIDPDDGKFSDGLELPDGRHLVTFDAFRMPLYMPTTTASSARSLTVWGAVRPAAYALAPVVAQIQFQQAGSSVWSTIQQVPITNPRGYFDVKVPFAVSGSVRVAFDPVAGSTEYSRTQSIRIR